MTVKSYSDPDFGDRHGRSWGILDVIRFRGSSLTAWLKLHHILFVAITLVAAVPVIVLASWVQSSAVTREIDAAREKDLVVAHNLTAAISRYVYDVTAGFQEAVSIGLSGQQVDGLQDLLVSLQFRHVVIIGPNGDIERFLPGLSLQPLAPMGLDTLDKFKAQAATSPRSVFFTDLGRDSDGNPAFMLLKALPNGRLAFGVISTNWLVEQQRAITFGQDGHSVLIDAKGKIVAHPLQSWVDQEFDQASTPPAKAIARGETGVMQFYSTAFQTEMITAYAPVPGTGWGVMVPQPVSELYDRARDIKDAAYLITAGGMLAAAVLSWLLAKAIARPLGAVAAVAGAVERGHYAARVPVFSPPVAQELRQLAQSFNDMVGELSRKNIELADTASRADTSNRAKTEFLANMSHELRTPLNAILGFSEVMRDGFFGPLSQRYQSYAGDIHASADHLLTVINDILDLSKAETGLIEAHCAPVRIPEVVYMALRQIEQLAKTTDVQLERNLDPALYERTIDTDKGKLTQILLNLLSNAVKFTKAGGKITVTGRLAPEMLEIIVQDNGIGIAEADIETVMTPFGQVQSAFHTRQGFGIGLPLSRKLVESMGGQLRLTSAPGVGTLATILLPYQSAAAVRPIT